jgi:hypothetical protein
MDKVCSLRRALLFFAVNVSMSSMLYAQSIDALERSCRPPWALESLALGAIGGNLSGLSLNGQVPSNPEHSHNLGNPNIDDGAPATRARSNIRQARGNEAEAYCSAQARAGQCLEAFIENSPKGECLCDEFSSGS